jgi:arylsulfatase
MNHLNFLRRLAPLIVSSFVAALVSPSAAAKPLNILVLLVDDWRYDTLGVAGDPVVLTPHLDQLAHEGVRFTQACATTAICGVSRATIFTGQWMSRHGNTAFSAFKTPWAETYPGLLRANNYYVGHVGKWHNGKFPQENFDFGRAYSGTHWMTEPDGTRIHVTQKNENDALEFLRTRPADKPFCLTLAFFATHAEDANPLQFLPQPQSMALYQNVTVPVPVNATDESFHRLPEFIANEQNEGRVRWHWRFDTPEKFQIMMKNYYRMATEVDTTCGRVLAELAKEGQLDNTLVIFVGDNGYYHAEHGLADKWYPHQESIRVPLIVRDPRMNATHRGQTDDNFALNVDLAPTILAAAGIAEPPRMQGRDLSPLYLADTKPTWRNEFFYEHATIRNIKFIPSSQGLVRKDWKYFLWPDFNREQLFDIKNDPHEEHDLIADPAQKKRLVEMRQRFAELKAAAK